EPLGSDPAIGIADVDAGHVDLRWCSVSPPASPVPRLVAPVIRLAPYRSSPGSERPVGAGLGRRSGASGVGAAVAPSATRERSRVPTRDATGATRLARRQSRPGPEPRPEGSHHAHRTRRNAPRPQAARPPLGAVPRVGQAG